MKPVRKTSVVTRGRPQRTFDRGGGGTGDATSGKMLRGDDRGRRACALR